MSEPSVCRLSSGPYLGDISALCFLHLPDHFSSLPYLLAGTGSQLLLYDMERGIQVKSFHVFEGIRVHGITCISIDDMDGALSSSLYFKIAVFGERRVKVFTLCIEMDPRFQDQAGKLVQLTLVQLLPKFSHWVLDVCFVKDHAGSLNVGSHRLAIGCSDNSVCFWDFLTSRVNFEARYPDRCLLYSMRIWGDKVEALRIASGTIYNEIIVWKVIPQEHASLRSLVEANFNLSGSFYKGLPLDSQQYEAVEMCRLAGHEGSIFRIAWSSDGSRLISVSDDRSARLWAVHAEREVVVESVGIIGSHSVGPVLFGHTARVWDCCIFDSLLVTAGEDCTCRVWGLDGSQLKMMREHIGRGIWRCLYDPNSSLLITAGFDSAIKAQQLHASLFKNSERHTEEVKEFTDRTKVFAVRIPCSTDNFGLMNSKSEYVRCLHFVREDALYVATNNGYLYHAKLSNKGDVKWTELVRVNEEVPIVCMDLLSKFSSSTIEDWVAVGDGKGNMTIASIIGDGHTPKVSITFTWSAEVERQLLGAYWCKSLGTRFIFTSDPRGTLKLWRLGDPLQSASHCSTKSCDVSLLAEFVSCFGARLMCLDALFEEEVLVCGDKRGNLVLFPFLKNLLLGTSVASEEKISSVKKISSINYFKGAHGISSVCSISVASVSSSQVEIHSTGGDGCICYLEYDKDQQTLEFLGMKQVKELSFVRCVCDNTSTNDLTGGSYAVGFSSNKFLIWNLISETKVVQVACGGWRRPYSYYLGDAPEMRNCFAFVKDEIIYIHSYSITVGERKIYPQNLHLQFHGREIHSICFIAEDWQHSSNQVPFSEPCWIATGCEDGTVRLTRYNSSVKEWSASKLLGEHIGGSAVRSIFFVSKIHKIAADVTTMPNGITSQDVSLEDGENPCLLISVGAKRVLTCWKQKKIPELNESAVVTLPDDGSRSGFKPSVRISSVSFQWLSTDMPIRNCSTRELSKNTENEVGEAENVGGSDAPYVLRCPENETESESCLEDKDENDWRYLAVTAFLVKVAYCRLTICFVVVACSDATLTLRALLLPYRIWFDVASLVPLPSPVLTLQHVIVPMGLPSEDDIQRGSVYLVISGSTDGSITFWDLTENVEKFSRSVSAFQIEKTIDCQKRPRTGRGSQGGRWWKSLGSSVSAKTLGDDSVTARTIERTGKNMSNPSVCGTPSKFSGSERGVTASTQPIFTASLPQGKTPDSSLELCRICPLQVLNNIHQSGVNCLHVSSIRRSRNSNFGCLYYILSGGDDQALHCLGFDLQVLRLSQHSENMGRDILHCLDESESTTNFICSGQNQNYSIRFSYQDKVASAHSSAVKGIWTDGCWVFSTGLDQRLRSWVIEKHGKLTERACLTISVPEPEALDAIPCGKDSYQIAIAGRGMQMVEFSASSGMHG